MALLLAQYDASTEIFDTVENDAFYEQLRERQERFVKGDIVIVCEV